MGKDGGSRGSGAGAVSGGAEDGAGSEDVAEVGINV